MPCLAITFGQAPQAVHRRLSQSATMASRTLSMGRFDGGFSNTLSARLTPFRQAFVACLSTTARNKPLTHEIAGPATMTGCGEPWGSEFTDRVTRTTTHNLGRCNRLAVDLLPGMVRQDATSIWRQTHFGCPGLDAQRVALDTHSGVAG